MTPADIRALADSLYNSQQQSVAPVLLALADLYASAQDYREAGYTWNLMADLKLLEELQP